MMWRTQTKRKKWKFQPWLVFRCHIHFSTKLYPLFHKITSFAFFEYFKIWNLEFCQLQRWYFEERMRQLQTLSTENATIKPAYTMRDACESCVKMSKIGKLCIVYRGWFASMRTWSYVRIVMCTISPPDSNFAHHQRKNSHSHFFGNAR